MVLGVFEGGELWTSIALRRGHGGFNLVLGPDEVRSDMGLLAGDWRRDYRHLSRAIEDRGSLLAFGCYAEVATLRRLEVDPNPGAWARAAALRELIVAPLPAPLAIPLGVRPSNVQRANGRWVSRLIARRPARSDASDRTGQQARVDQCGFWSS